MPAHTDAAAMPVCSITQCDNYRQSLKIFSFGRWDQSAVWILLSL